MGFKIVRRHDLARADDGQHAGDDGERYLCLRPVDEAVQTAEREGKRG